MISPGVLIVLDGWGLSPREIEYDAIRLASTPVMDELLARYPWTTLQASGEAVGLPPGVVGNSEIGHLTIGAGRVIEYESTRVERAAATGELIDHPVLRTLLERVRTERTALHLLGLCSDGMVHSHIGHFAALLETARVNGVTRVFLHPSTDGRDVPNGTAEGYLEQLGAVAKQVGIGTVATVMGRAYTMDRNGNWDLTRSAYEAVTLGAGRPIRDPREAARAASGGLPDERVPPSIVVDRDGNAIGRIQDGDALIFVNFRGDRMRQLLRAFTVVSFDEFPRGPRPEIDVLTLTEYFSDPPVRALFSQADASAGLADRLEHHGVRNLRVAETDKFPHVTFFLNGRDRRRRAFEEHSHVPSPKGVEYSQAPELSADIVTDRLVRAMKRQEADLVVANLANADVVGHTGDLGAVRRAVQTVDRCLGRICEAAWKADRWVAMVGDHGNAEVMRDPDAGKPHVGHTTNPVPFVLAHPGFDGLLKPEGTLADVATTVVDLLGLPAGGTIAGESLLAYGVRRSATRKKFDGGQ